MAITEIALIFTMCANTATAISVIVATLTLKRGGPQVVVESGTAGGKIYIAVGNVGRQPISVKGYGLGTVKRRRRQGLRIRRPYGFSLLMQGDNPAPGLWVALPKPLSLGPGASEVWVLDWPEGVVEAQVEALIKRSAVAKRKPVTGPDHAYVQAAVKTFAAYKHCRVKVDPVDTSYVQIAAGAGAGSDDSEAGGEGAVSPPEKSHSTSNNG
ncbi:hypothetical protein ACFZAE_29060 [Streptomyces scabiei]|uniref:hypothetical protein n=1 Tax=Streptomyces scabiei TaxID=1930 RepID=UPI0036E9C4F0